MYMNWQMGETEPVWCGGTNTYDPGSQETEARGLLHGYSQLCYVASNQPAEALVGFLTQNPNKKEMESLGIRRNLH